MKPRLPNRRLLVQSDDILWARCTIKDGEYNESLIDEFHHEVSPKYPTGFKVYSIFAFDPYVLHVGVLIGAGLTRTLHLQATGKPLEDFYKKPETVKPL